ncbi:response regulator [Cardiobacteriaceae bacterium TAE3-ERU3]|nr:response regulator [Cardiobacteriaceae bacterium TAE3-ERU3]
MYKLMVVDDSNIIRNQIARMQKDKQFEIVAKARNGLEAIKFAKVHRPDVVTMDLTMPEMGGLECIKALVADNPKILILVISALSDKTTGIRALSLGASGFLCKPFTEEELLDALQELVN